MVFGLTILFLHQSLPSHTRNLSPPCLPAVVFGLTIICTALAMVLVVSMKWEKSASLSVALLWLVVVVLMFLGVGGCPGSLCWLH